MHEASTERFICHLTTREDGVVQYYTKNHTQVAHLTTSMDDTHIEVWMHTRKRCADGRCKKPIAKFNWAEQAVEPEPDFIGLLEMLFGKDSVIRAGAKPVKCDACEGKGMLDSSTHCEKCRGLGTVFQN